MLNISGKIDLSLSQLKNNLFEYFKYIYMFSDIIESILNCCGYYARKPRRVEIIVLTEDEKQEIREFILRKRNCIKYIICC